MYQFTIKANDYLHKDTLAFYHTDYVGYQQPGNPDFINALKNTFDNDSEWDLMSDIRQLETVLRTDLPIIYRKLGKLTVCVVPRAKASSNYSSDQLLFKSTIQKYVKNSNGCFLDGTNYIIRHTNTKTTHLSKAMNIKNDGEMPYVGITSDTCKISPLINGKKVLLIDDIYTASINIDEDCIQTLYENGAHEVVFYAVAKTIRRF